MPFTIGATDRPECQTCGLFRKARHPFIPPVVEDAGRAVDLVIVGEAPGKTEDARGEVFCGKAGKLLDEMLSASDLAGCNVAFANSLQCWPGADAEGKDNKPTMEQVRCCRPLLVENLNQIQAGKVVGVGQWGGRALSDVGTLTLAGKTPQRLRTLPVPGLKYTPDVATVTYHPAAPLHGQPWLKDIIISDFNEIANKTEKRRSHQVPRGDYEYRALTLGILHSLVGQPAVFDAEYSGTTPTLYSIALQVQGVNWAATICRPDAEYDPCDWRKVLQEFLDNCPLLAGHNVREDLLALARFRVRLPEFLPLADSLTLSRMLWENAPDRGLNTLAIAKLGMDDYEEDIRPYKKESPTDFGATAPKDILLRYNVGDVVASARLLREHFSTVPRPLWDVLMEAEYNLVLATWDGQHIDAAALKTMLCKYANKERAALKALRQLTGQKTFDPNSEEGAAYPFHVLKWRAWKQGKAGPSLDKEVLLRAEYEAKRPKDRQFARAMLTYREAVVHLRRLRNDIAKNMDERGCVHARFNTAAARTLRDSSNGPNFQNLAPEIRNIFTPRW